PNNPTGQVISLSEIREIIIEANKTSTAVIIDETYGDYMNDENTAIQLINEFSNVFVVRSFSKGYGLAGQRIGYVVANENLIELYGLIDDYLINNIGLKAAELIVENTTFIKETQLKISQMKNDIIKSINKLKVAKTSK